MNLTNNARLLRKNQTDVEQLLWNQLRNRRLFKYKFRRQFPIEPYIADFACLELKLIIELDGVSMPVELTMTITAVCFLSN
jgi:very-short-patch-repair endonuclease